uniref:Uncharacterized protein n=1 Tax=Leersia perrieri TaxID=77586 RepID=A0A0D9W5V2_9ORYZ
MVVRDVPQRHRHGRRRRAQLAVRHGSPRMGPRDGGAGGVVGDDAVHAAAADRAARVRARGAVRPVPRPGRARAGPAPRPLARRAAAAHRAARLRRRVHGHRRQVPPEVRRVGVVVPAPPRFLLDLHLRLVPVRPLPAPLPRLHHRRLPRRGRHVAQLLDDLVGGVRREGAGRRRELRVRVRKRGRRDGVGGRGVPCVQRAGAGGVRVRGARRCAGDPGDGAVDAREAVEGAHVEGRRGGVPRHGALLLPRRVRRVLGVRPRRPRQRARRTAPPAVARRGRQHDGRRPRPRQLPGLRHADLRDARGDFDHQAQGASRRAPPSRGTISLRRGHAVRRGGVPVLRRPARLLRGLRVHADFILPPLHSMAEDQEASEVQRVVVCQLGLHRRWSAADDRVYHRRATKHHPGCLDVPILLVSCELVMVMMCTN